MKEGIERIKVLASETKDKAVLKIVDYLTTRNDMNDKYLNEEKSLKQMINFIKSKAEKQAKNGMAMIDDEVVYGWAIHYWDETNDLLGLCKEKIAKSNVLEKKESVKKIQKAEPKKKNWVPEGQLSLFDL